MHSVDFFVGESVAVWGFCVLPALLYLVARSQWGRIGPVCLRLAPVAVVYVIYEGIRYATAGGPQKALALGNAEGLVGVEKFLHIWCEPFLSHHPIPFAEGYYQWAQLVVTFGLLTFLALHEDDAFWKASRNALAFGTLAAFGVFYLLPMAPPRLLPGSFRVAGPGLGALTGVADQVAAFPSVHTVWAGWVCAVCFTIGARQWWRWLGLVNLVLTMTVVLTTGNHYVLDVVAGEVVSLAAVWLTDRPVVEGPPFAARIALVNVQTSRVGLTN